MPLELTNELQFVHHAVKRMKKRAGWVSHRYKVEIIAKADNTNKLTNKQHQRNPNKQAKLNNRLNQTKQWHMYCIIMVSNKNC